MQNPQAAQNAILGFEDKRLLSLTEIIPQRGTNTRIKSGLIQQLIGKENISDYEGLKKLMAEHLSAQEAEALDKVLKPAFEAYLSFYNKNKDTINKNLEAMNSAQSVFCNDLNNLYQCFSIPEDKQCNCYLNPFPKDKVIDGISNPENVSMDYSLNRNEDAANYIENSDILKRKASTPFHEATHFLFLNSQFKKDLENEANPQMKRLLNSVIKSLENGKQDSNTDRNQIKAFAIGAINEAFAACSSALYNEKTTGKAVNNDNEWYHGWKQANDLAKQMYPLFKEYMEKGKPFDGEYVTKLSNIIEINNLKSKIANKRHTNKLSRNQHNELETTPKPLNPSNIPICNRGGYSI